ncbi:TonB-dependent receptor [Novosphingobium profundi]|uniref:TonB-dependent receptor n=1 Tax=Novosphingobium profundi TaxID=1774954 RepID=UPI001BDA9444|nr:TonB-dependent receptor [Novosphingobium profundi]MBT0670819.1 TonB-dependent receptor [Novosphingobium profundi]
MKHAAFTPRGTACAVIALATGLTLGLGTARAQDTSQAQESHTVGAQEIIVTAQFREQRLQDTPIAITATSGAELEAKNIESVTDLTAIAPNVNLSEATGLNGSAVQAYIRGIGQNDSSFALEPGVGIYIDDVYYGTTFGAILDLNDLDRVEVLRGPQGTLSGKNSIGGSIKLFSRKPDEVSDGFVEATTGSYGRIDLRGSAGFTITDGLYARISGVSKHTDGFFKLLDYGCVFPDSGIAAQTTRKSCVSGTEGGIDVQGGRLALRYAPSGSALEVNLIADYAKNDSEQVATKLLYANSTAVRSYVADDPSGGIPFDSRFLTGKHAYSSYANYASGGNYTTVFGTNYQVAPGTYDTSPESTAKSWGVAGTIDLALADNLALKSITAYRKASGTTGIDLDGSPLSVLVQEFDYDHAQFTQELRLSGQVQDFLDFTVGGYYYDADDNIAGRVLIPQPLFDFVEDDPVTNRSVSAFAHTEFHITPDLNVIAGIRYTDDKKTYQFTRRNPDGTLPSGIPLTTNFLVAGLDGQVGTFKGTRTDYRLGINYRFTPELMVYAQVATGYKGGGINPRPYTPDQIVAFDPETLTTWEGGFKSDLFDRRVRFNGTVFYNRYKNLQINRYYCPESVSTTCSQPANAGDADVWGLEGELFAEPLDGLTIDGSLGYLNFQYTRVDPTTYVEKDMVAPFNPSWQTSAGIQYRAELGGKRGTLTPRLDWTYQSSFYFNSINNDYNKIAARSLFNLRLTYLSDDENWQLAGGVTNLFDRFYYTGVAENVNNYGVNTGTVGRPREWFVSLRRAF